MRAYFQPRRGAMVALGLALVATTVLPLLGPQLLGRFVDQAIAGRATRALIGTALAYLVVAVAAQVVRVATAYGSSRTAWSLTNRLREDLTEHALGLDLAFHAGRTPGEMIERVDGDVAALAEFFSLFVLNVIGSGLLLVGTVAVVWVQEWRMGIVFTGLVAGAGTVLWRSRRRAVPAATAEREATAQLFGGLEERLVGVEDIRANGAGAHVVNRFHEASAGVYAATLRSQRAVGGLIAGTNLVFSIGSAAVLATGIVLLRRDAMTVGTIVLLFQYTQLVHRPLEQITEQLKQFQQAAAGAARAAELFGIRPTMTGPGAGRPLPAGPVEVRFDHVTMAYGTDEPVLHDLTFTVGAGRSLGLVGRSGAGKTTIARLLLRLYRPTAGSVSIGGVDIADLSDTDLRRNVAIVTQDVQLFAADLRANLTMFHGGVDDARLIEVLHQLGLGQWFESLPAGLDSVLGAGGIGLSAGEGQLLAFARVFLADPRVVVLDEASSRLDPATEHLIERAVDRLLEGRTAIVIAHRLSSLDRVDEVLVLDHGRVLEHGGRAELVADDNSRFAQLLAVSGGRR